MDDQHIENETASDEVEVESKHEEEPMSIGEEGHADENPNEDKNMEGDIVEEDEARSDDDVPNSKEERGDDEEDEGNKEKEEKEEEEEEEEEANIEVAEEADALPAKRARKSTEVLTVDTFDESKKPVDFDVPKGSGTTFQDLECIQDSVSSKNTKDHQVIVDAFHKFLYSGQPLKLRGQKKVPIKTAQMHILQFSGFEGLVGVDHTPEEIKEKYEEKCNSATIPLLKAFCDLLCLDRSGCTTKIALTNRLLGFLESPEESKIKQSYINALKKKRKAMEKSSKEDKKQKNKKVKKEKNMEEESDGESEDDASNNGEADIEEIDGVSFPTEKWVRKWVRAYLSCFNTDNVTTKHAIATASNKFGVDFNVTEKKNQLKEIIAEEIDNVVNWKSNP